MLCLQNNKNVNVERQCALQRLSTLLPSCGQKAKTLLGGNRCDGQMGAALGNYAIKLFLLFNVTEDLRKNIKGRSN